MIKTSRSHLSTILAAAALLGYVCLLMTCLVCATADHCDDQHCDELGECHCACGLWVISPTNFVMPQPLAADRDELVTYAAEPAEPIAELFRPPRV